MREVARAALKRGIATLELGPADERLAEVLPVLGDSYRLAQQFVSEARRSIDQLSPVEGLRNALLFPLGWLTERRRRPR